VVLVCFVFKKLTVIVSNFELVDLVPWMLSLMGVHVLLDLLVDGGNVHLVASTEGVLDHGHVAGLDWGSGESIVRHGDNMSAGAIACRLEAAIPFLSAKRRSARSLMDAAVALVSL
jgi:hypothetical protein